MQLKAGLIYRFRCVIYLLVPVTCGAPRRNFASDELPFGEGTQVKAK
jgi:hypothetical protein